MTDFTIGESIRIEDLSEDDAVLIFGRPVYETWLATKDEPRGTVTCTGIDSGRTLTFVTVKA